MHLEICKETYCNTEDTTGQSKLHEDTEPERLSRYIILSHHAGMRFFSPESYPKCRQYNKINPSEAHFNILYNGICKCKNIPITGSEHSTLLGSTDTIELRSSQVQTKTIDTHKQKSHSIAKGTC